MRSPASGFEELAARRYDLYLVCGLDVPFADDGVRDLEAQRQWMQERLLAHARESGLPWVLLAGPPEARLAAACEAVDALAN